MTTNEGIDSKILKMIDGKDLFVASAILMGDLNRKNPAFYKRWNEVYDKEPSLGHVADETLYYKLMLDKYLRVYLACQTPIENN